MNQFTRIPDDIFEKILSYLPFEDLLRVGRVDQAFRRMSITEQIRIKTINFYNYRPANPRRVTPDALASILDRCYPNLKSITFQRHIDFADPALLTAFAQFELPALEFLDLGTAEIDHDVFERILTNCRSLKTLIVEGNRWMEDQYPNVLCPTLTTINAYTCSEAQIRSIAHYAPNLRNFKTCIPVRVTSQAWDSVFDRCAPQMETFHLSQGHGGDCNFNLGAQAPFWRATTIRLLGLNVYGHQNATENEVLARIGQHFATLETLELYLSAEASSQGVGELGRLKNLRKLTISNVSSNNNDFNVGIAQLVNCTRMRHLDLVLSLTAINFVNLIRSFPEMSLLAVKDVIGVDSEDAALAVVQSLVGLAATRVIKLALRFKWWQQSNEVWKADRVKQAMAAIEGRVIVIDYEEPTVDYWNTRWWQRME